MINEALANIAQSNDLVSKALRLSMKMTADWMRDYLGQSEGEYRVALERIASGDYPMATVTAAMQAEARRALNPGESLNDGVFPHERGSIDTYDDMRASLRLTSGLLEMALDGDGDQRERMQRLVRDESCSMALSKELEELIFPGWDEDRITDFVLSEEEGKETGDAR